MTNFQQRYIFTVVWMVSKNVFGGTIIVVGNCLFEFCGNSKYNQKVMESACSLAILNTNKLLT